MEVYIYLGVAVVLSIVALTLTKWVLSLRRVVPTNEAHIVQRKKSTVSYGKDHPNGNTYYAWPMWIPVIGIQSVTMPVSNFSIRLENYEAYDKGRLPFVLDMEAFFQINDTNIAAQRVSSFTELTGHLKSILQGAARTILASKDIEEIMQGRAEFGVAFTHEVDEQLKSWGTRTVKNIELMDIRDNKESRVIANIMEKKKSFIEMESRIEVAENIKKAENKEIDVRREVDINKQLAIREVGIKTAEQEREVGIANEKAQQEIKTEQKITTERQMEVVRVGEVKTAEIHKDVNIVKANEAKQTDVIKAEGEKQKTIIIAEGKLEEQKRLAEGTLAEGQAVAESEKLMQLAPVEAQIVLAKEIGSNEGYQGYLVTIRQVEANEKIGVQQAAALQKADIKVIANTGTTVGDGLNNVGELFTAKAGTGLAGALEGLAQSDVGQELLAKFLPGVADKK